jgi:N,N-dimethylformamidase
VLAAWVKRQDDRGPIYGAHFDGKLEAPRLQRGVLSSEELQAQSGIEVPRNRPENAVGWWDFASEFDTGHFADLSGNELHGVLQNLPTRGVTGLLWNGSEHDWRQAPEQYAAIHFHSDDLYDAGWKDSFALEVPVEWKSGLYAARLRSESGEDRIPFFVAPPKNTSASRLAFLVPTATYLAYANMPDPHEIVRELSTASKGNASERLQEVIAGGEFGPSCYHAHSDGSGVHHSSHLRPVLNMRPRPDLWAFNADTLIPDWLDELGFDYDIITDDLLHAEGAALLEPYRAVVTGTHPEYATTAMLDALEQYSTSGGRLVYLGANGFYWRVAFSDAWPGAIELRRAEDGTRAWESQPGEYHHAWGGELGGLWRRIGRPPNRLVGVGFAAQGFISRSGYRRSPAASDPRAAFIFDGVDSEVFGAKGRGGGAAGEEIDRFDEALGSPPNALVLASAGDFGPDVIKTKEEFLAMVPPDPSDPDVRADLVFFETPNGGAVFSTGSIAWASSLAGNNYDNDISRITRNVVRRFLDARPFPAPD